MNYVLSENAAKQLSRLLKDAKAVKPVDLDRPRRMIPDVPTYPTTPTFWQVKYDAVNGWIVRVAENATSVDDIHVHGELVSGETEWYKIVNAPVGTTVGAFAVYAHVKRRVKVGSGAVEECVFVSAGAVGSSTLGEEPANYSAGDFCRIRIAVCTTTAVTESGATTYAHSVQRVHRDKIMVESRPQEALDLYWAVPEVSSSGWTTFTPHVAQCEAPLCGGTLADTALSASGGQNVYYQVDCSSSSGYQPSIQTSSNSSIAVVSLRVFHIDDGVVTVDYRFNLNTQVFFV